MKLVGKTITYTLMAFAICASLKAQQPPKRCLSPGLGPKFTITLEGATASTIQNVNVTVLTHEHAPKDQIASFGSPGANASSPGVFEVTVFIPANAVSGTYSLTDINASGQGFNIGYHSREDFMPPPDFEVCNPAYHRPNIKSVIEKP